MMPDVIWEGKPVRNAMGLPAEKISVVLQLLVTAHGAKANAYSPYSGVKVGAALLANNGEVITGVNVENGSLGLTICAERTALFRAVSQGFRPGDFTAIAVAASAEGFSPCGACREVINEFGQDMIIAFEYGGEVIVSTLKAMLAYNFIRGKEAL
jgi:cytidine deaminase